MLAVNHLQLSYNNQEVLTDFNLSLSDGEIFALLGSSGSGKSSALRFIAGLDSAQAGTVEIDGQQLSTAGQHQVQPEAREVGMVFQDYALFPHMTIEKNIAFGLHGRSGEFKQGRVEELLSLIGLSGIEKKYPHQLSGGERQRVALARALAPNPKILLLDEPFSSLDADKRQALVVQVRDILKQSGMTSILVTHDKDEANMFADRVGQIQNRCLA